MVDERKNDFGNKENRKSSNSVNSREFGDFEEVSREEGSTNFGAGQNSVPTRVKKPREGEVIGVIVQRLGGNKMEVNCTDGKTRNARVPGRFKRSMWLRPRDVVIVKPWEYDDDKADVVFKYNSSAVHQLRKSGVLDSVKEGF